MASAILGSVDFSKFMYRYLTVHDIHFCSTNEISGMVTAAASPTAHRAGRSRTHIDLKMIDGPDVATPLVSSHDVQLAN